MFTDFRDWKYYDFTPTGLVPINLLRRSKIFVGA